MGFKKGTFFVSHHVWPEKRKTCIKHTFSWRETASKKLNMTLLINTLGLKQQFFGV